MNEINSSIAQRSSIVNKILLFKQHRLYNHCIPMRKSGIINCGKVDINMILNKLSVKGLRSLRNVSIKLDKFGIIIGKNDIGKSSILRAIDIFL